jgi:hypothetical protein
VTTNDQSIPLPSSSVDDRLRAFHATGDADRLWPDVPASARTTALRAIEGVASAVLSGHRPASLVAQDERAVRALGISAFTSGLGPLLGYWIERGAVEASPAVRDVMALHRNHAGQRNRRLWEALDGMLGALSGAGVPTAVLKGAHTTRQYFPDEAARTMTDLDVLVSPTQASDAVAALRAHGLVQISQGKLPPRSEWAPAGPRPAVASLELTHADSPWTLDLHTTLNRRLYFRHIAGPGVPQARDLQRVPGHSTMAGLAQPLLTAFLAFHASTHFPRLQMIHLVELVFVIRADTAAERLDWDDLGRLLVRTKSAGLAFPAFALTDRLVPGTVKPELLRLCESSAGPRIRRRIRDLAPADAHDIGLYALRDKLLWSRTPWETALNLLDLVWPVHQVEAVADFSVPYVRRLRMLFDRRLKL